MPPKVASKRVKAQKGKWTKIHRTSHDGNQNGDDGQQNSSQESPKVRVRSSVTKRHNSVASTFNEGDDVVEMEAQGQLTDFQSDDSDEDSQSQTRNTEINREEVISDSDADDQYISMSQGSRNNNATRSRPDRRVMTVESGVIKRGDSKGTKVMTDDQAVDLIDDRINTSLDSMQKYVNSKFASLNKLVEIE